MRYLRTPRLVAGPGWPLALIFPDLGRTRLGLACLRPGKLIGLGYGWVLRCVLSALGTPPVHVTTQAESVLTLGESRAYCNAYDLCGTGRTLAQTFCLGMAQSN